MTAKRALIVDDSRSARIILGRILESYEMQVDTAESAEEALEYLRLTRPDVIFLDHLMPGMDGFQAIHAIKSNPDTAMIPVMMYTSQEGELYVSQARALGAVGVLPKTVKQTDVSRLLSQLRLLPDAESISTSTVLTQAPSKREVAETGAQNLPALSRAELETALRVITNEALQLHSMELRRFVASSLEAFARRINAEGRAPGLPTQGGAAMPAAMEGFQDQLPALVETYQAPPPSPPSRSLSGGLLAAVFAVALVPTVVMGVIYARNDRSAQALMQTSGQLKAAVEQQQVQLGALQEQLREAARLQAVATRDKDVMSEAVPYGEPPLGGARLERLQGLVDELTAQGFKGKVKVAAYVGEFCLSGNGSEGYAIATEELPWRRCDLIGNPFEDSLPVAQRQTLEFANTISSLRKRASDSLSVEIVYRGRRPNVPYPQGERLTKVTAGEWNRIAAQNNRVEFIMQPQGAASSRAVASDLPAETTLTRPRG
jgi:CheY-like chemotaxis protein